MRGTAADGARFLPTSNRSGTPSSKPTARPAAATQRGMDFDALMAMAETAHTNRTGTVQQPR